MSRLSQDFIMKRISMKEENGSGIESKKVQDLQIQV